MLGTAGRSLPRSARHGAEQRFLCAQHYADRAALLTRRAIPPPYGCFTVPRFQMLPALEALLGVIFANLFWVGLWDLLDNTIFPNDTTGQMMLLVRGAAASARAAGR